MNLFSWFIGLCSWTLVLPALASQETASYPGAEVLDLGGKHKWTVTNSNGSVRVPAEVPGMVQTDLFREGVIDDPYYSNNFNYTRWISDDSWTFKRNLPAASENGKKWSEFRKVFLVFDGLDTAAHVKINGKKIGFANNQFRQWTFDITEQAPLLAKGASLEVEFESAIKYALGVFEDIGAPYTVFTNYFWEYPEGREYIRKIQSDFGWDWGPHFSPSGIYRDAYLVGLDDGPVVTNTFVDIYKMGQRPNTIPDQTAPWVVNVSVDYLSANPGADVKLKADVGGFQHSVVQKAHASSHSTTASLSFNIPEGAVERWWPHDLGKPKMYNMTIELGSSSSKDTWKTTKRVGFRTIVLNLEPYSDRFGNNFHFEVNGNTFNAKGSNLVPVDAFEPRISDDWYRRILQSSVASNFNILRLWSSGNYYRDSFYEAADELGIFLWSEFQFSDNFYPATPDFLENVREEVYYQVRRLNRHPSMAVWTGGNELEGYNLDMLSYNATWGQDFFRNFTKLEMETVWPELYKNTRSLSWIQSSDSHGYSYYNPENGAWLNRYGDVATEYPSPYYGPAELYNLETDQAFNHSKLPASRFVVEFGIWSYDSLESYQTILPDSDIHPNNPIIIQRCYDDGPDTVGILAEAVKTYYVFPNRTDHLAQFDQLSWTTQIYQAEHIKNQIESYRRSISLPENNLGQIFWQLNAPWTTLSLNSIEYTERWKVLQYVAKQVFQPVAVSSWIEPKNSTYNLWITSDSLKPVKGSVKATWMTWEGETIDVTEHNFSLGGLDSKQLEEKHKSAILPPKAKAADVVLLLNATGHGENGEVFSSQNFLVPDHLSGASIVDPGLKVKRVGDHTWRVSATRGVAAYVWLSHPIGVTGYFDENAIFMAKGESRDFTFTVLEDTTKGKWVKEVRVRSIWDNLEISK